MLLGNFEKASLINAIEFERKQGDEIYVHERQQILADEESGVGGRPFNVGKFNNISQKDPLKSILKKPTNFDQESESSPGGRKKKRQ